MTPEEYAAVAKRHERADRKSCERGEHVTHTPIFADAHFGGLRAWSCWCGVVKDLVGWSWRGQ